MHLDSNEILAEIAEIDRSPVLTTFHVQVQAVRGRFYLSWQWDPDAEPEESSTVARITPLRDESGLFLLEAALRKEKWSEIKRGSPKQLVRSIATDKSGSYHGVGSLETSLRRAEKQGVERLKVTRSSPKKFHYADTRKPCSVQETLYHYFGLPVHVIAQPASWYAYRRTPKIVEYTKDRTRVLVRFIASSWSGETFGGTCLYLLHDDQWGAYTIRPNRSENIAMAEAWLVKRKWNPW